MKRFANPTGGKTYLFSIIFDIAVQIAFSMVLSAVVIVGGYGSAAELPRYSTWNIVAMFFFAGRIRRGDFRNQAPAYSSRKKIGCGMV